MLGKPELGFIADCHVGNPRWRGGVPEAGVNRRGALVLDALVRAAQLTAKSGAHTLVVLGDLFDASDTTPQLMAAVMRRFMEAGVRVLVLLGNHDQESTAEGDNALGPLRFVERVGVVEQVTVVREGMPMWELWLVPFRPGDAREWLPGALALAAEQSRTQRGGATRPCHRALALHLGVVDGTTPPFLRDAHDAIPLEQLRALCTEHSIDSVFAGNWHERRLWTFDGPALQVLQCGALVPTGFNNPGLEGYGTVAVWTPGEPIEVNEMVGPRFVQVTSLGGWKALVDAVKAAKLPGDGEHALPMYPPVFVRWTVENADEIAEAEGLLREECTLGVLAGGEVLPGTKAVEAKARDAATVARRAETLENAAAAYVGALGLAVEDVQPVQTLVLGYIGGAA